MPTKLFGFYFILPYLFGVVWSSQAFSASFDCAKSSQKMEVMVCADATLSSLDEQMAVLYKHAIRSENLQHASEARRTQRDWLLTTKNCKNIECLRSAYDERISFLSSTSFKHKEILVGLQTDKAKSDWQFLASGKNHSCVANSNTIKCWGNKTAEKLVPPRKFNGITQLTSYNSDVCAKDASGWECWGECEAGVCDIPNGYKNADSLSLGVNFACGLKNGLVKCWGNNRQGATDVPVYLQDVVDVKAGAGHACAVIRGGAVVCWGSNEFGLISSAKSLPEAKIISLGTSSTCIINQENKVECAFSKGTDFIPGYEDLHHVSALSSGFGELCVIHGGGALFCTESSITNGFKKISLNNRQYFSVAQGELHVCALSKEGVSCWGAYANENLNLYKFTYPAEAAMNEALLLNEH